MKNYFCKYQTTLLHSFLIIVMLEIITGSMGNLYLASNAGQLKNSKTPTFWLVQESEEYLYFQWIPFEREYYGALKLQLDEQSISRDMRDDMKAAKLRSLAPACQFQHYSITQSKGRKVLGYYDVESRKLSYKRSEFNCFFPQKHEQI
ncbi:unnamed protein product [Schistosoma turkestanicum]|nr:unnamed protein product [Schistosoma turkestanicum]